MHHPFIVSCSLCSFFLCGGWNCSLLGCDFAASSNHTHGTPVFIYPLTHYIPSDWTKWQMPSDVWKYTLDLKLFDWLRGRREKEAIIRCESETKTAISQLWNANSNINGNNLSSLVSIQNTAQFWGVNTYCNGIIPLFGSLVSTKATWFHFQIIVTSSSTVKVTGWSWSRPQPAKFWKVTT